MTQLDPDARAVHDRFLEVRDQIERGERPWGDLADFFSEQETGNQPPGDGDVCPCVPP